MNNKFTDDKLVGLIGKPLIDLDEIAEHEITLFYYERKKEKR